ncbi:AAA family ATPase [Clostridium faecium]|uniref:AAA family ATPase n=1 Tax=Clostridium faecium TaxID=2762223 RepID=A0ABR8YNL9_9CLOT|nr:AAA family ATPase [Clostridium faecium]MBD8045842.1 AAA family ATPase [Clostridium faecium]
MKIAFWSNYHGQAGVTSNAIAIAVNLAMKYNVRVLLAHTQYVQSNMENAFLSIEERNLNDLDIGIDAIERVARSKDLNEENFASFTKSLIKNRLDLLEGSYQNRYELFEKINDTVTDILYYANKAYDFVFIDLNSGFNNSITNKVLEQSDIIIVNLSQNEKVIKDYFEKDKKELERITGNKKIILNIGNYDFNSKCSKKYINKAYKYNDEIFCTPYIADFKDAINNHKVIDYFMINRNINNAFFEEVSKISEKLMIIDEKKLEIYNDPIKKQTFTQKFKSILEG